MRAFLSRHLFRSDPVHRSFRTRSKGAVLTGRAMGCVYRSRRRGWWGRDCCTAVPLYWSSNADYGPRRCPAPLEPRWPTDLLCRARLEDYGSPVRLGERKGRQAAYCFHTRIVAPNLSGFQYDVAPDGRFLVNSLPSNGPPPLTLITGWENGR